MAEQENQTVEETELAEETAAAEEAVEEVAEEETAVEEQPLAKLFTLNFRISEDEYFAFHKIMGAEAQRKGKRKTQLLGALEFLFGVGFLISLITTQTQGGIFYYFMIAVLIAMGAYGMLYHKFFYENSLRRAVAKQYTKVSYLQNEIVIDFYPNRLVEHVHDQNIETFWHTIKELRVNDNLYMIMLEERRCLLIPKSGVDAEHKDAFEALLRDVCANYEKARYEL